MTTSIPTIFIIDDQESVRYALGEMLNVFGFAVETYESADAFLSMLDRSRPGCVVADVPMAVAAIKAGAEDFIEKPIDDVQLVAAINRGLARLFEQQTQEKSIETLATQFARLTPRQSAIDRRDELRATAPRLWRRCGPRASLCWCGKPSVSGASPRRTTTRSFRIRGPDRIR